MSKRAPGLPRVKNDFYPTGDPRAVAPLLRHLQPGTRFVEPCAGDGVLIGHLCRAGHRLADAYDIDPRCAWIRRADAVTEVPRARDFVFISNPPWRRDILHPMIVHLSNMAPTWLLFDADWIHIGQSEPYMPRLRKVVSVGRVKWIADSKGAGKDNCAWHLFTAPDPHSPPLFFGRRAA